MEDRSKVPAVEPKDNSTTLVAFEMERIVTGLGSMALAEVASSLAFVSFELGSLADLCSVLHILLEHPS